MVPPYHYGPLRRWSVGRGEELQTATIVAHTDRQTDRASWSFFRDREDAFLLPALLLEVCVAAYLVLVVCALFYCKA